MVRRKVLDLSAAGPITIVDPRSPVGAIWVEDWPTGATMQLRLGEQSEPIDITGLFAYELYGSDRVNGITAHVEVAQPGVQVIVYVSSADSQAGVG